MLTNTDRFPYNFYCRKCLSPWCLFVFDDLWYAVLCFHPPILFIGKVWVPVMHFWACPKHCKFHWRSGRRLGSCRLISAQNLIESTIRAFSISSALWVLEVRCCLHWHSFYHIDHRTLWWMVIGVNRYLISVVSGVPPSVFWASYCSSSTDRSFIHSGKSADSTLIVVPSPDVIELQ